MELRKHREISEIIFGLGLKGTIDFNDIDTRMVVYPYNAAIDERLSNPDKANQAYLMSKYGADAINAAKHAAEIVHNGIAPEEWLIELTRVYQNFKIVNVAQKTIKKIEKDQDVNFDELKDAIDSRLADHSAEPLSWGDIQDEFKQEWLWSQWIPYGELTIIVGRQGAGKSAFALYLADCVANGTYLPDGSVIGETQAVAWVETEGRFAENVRRARAWNVDPKHIYSPSQDARKVIDLNEPDDRALVRALATKPEVGLVIIDSLGGSLMDENDSTAKKTLQDLSRMAQETATTFLIIHHLRKQQKHSKGHKPPELDDVRGHGGITQFAPSVIAIDYDGNEGARFLMPLKMNLVKMPPPMSFVMETNGLIFDNATHDQVRRKVVQETVVWMESILASGPLLIKEVKELSEKEGYDWDIVKQAISFPSINLIKNHQGERCLSL